MCSQKLLKHVYNRSGVERMSLMKKRELKRIGQTQRPVCAQTDDPHSLNGLQHSLNRLQFGLYAFDLNLSRRVNVYIYHLRKFSTYKIEKQQDWTAYNLWCVQILFWASRRPHISWAEHVSKIIFALRVVY